MPLVPILSVLASLYLMLNLTAATWVRFFVWMAVGLVVYAVYGYRRSRLGTEGPERGTVDLRDRDRERATVTSTARRTGGTAPSSH